jgi:hypothetical protein
VETPLTHQSGELVLHIGTMKSGSTYLQRVLAANVDRLNRAGWSYPLATSGLGPHFDESGFNQSAALHGLLGSHVPWITTDRQRRLAPLWHTLSDALRSVTGSKVLSAESLASLDPEGIRDLFRELPMVPTRVVITSRDLARVIPSSWQQNVRNGRASTLDQYLGDIARAAEGATAGPSGTNFWRSYRVGRLIRRWADEVGIDRVVLVTVPRDTTSATLWQRFIEACGLPRELGRMAMPELNGYQANRSLGWASAIALEQTVARMVAAGVAVGRVRVSIQPMVDRLLEVVKQDVPIRTPTHWMSAVRRWAWEDCAEIAATGVRVVGQMSDMQVGESAAGGVAPGPHEVERFRAFAQRADVTR